MKTPLRAADYRLLLSLGLGVLFTDWLTKALAANLLSAGRPVSLFRDYARLSLSHNPGAAFGMRFGSAAVHLLVTLAVIAFIVAIALHTAPSRRLEQAGYGLILGGAIGNLGDRLLLGHVIDFLDLGIGNVRWWTFNVADAALTAGVGLLLIASFRSRRTVQ